MTPAVIKQWRSALSGLILLVVLAAAMLTACAGITDQPAADSAGIGAPADSKDVPAIKTQPPVLDSGAPTATAMNNESTILSDDDRPDNLKALTQEWKTNWSRHTVDYNELLSGGPPRDGIPPLDEPDFVTPEEATSWLAPNEPVVLFVYDGDARAYPLQVLTWHEIVNDTVAGLPTAITFCPLCNSAIVFERRVDGQETTFGTSGLLRNSDLVMWDRTTESLWQQFTGEGIAGDYAGKQLTLLPSAIISFADFHTAYPEGKILSRNTGYNRPYGQNPYAGYDRIGENPFLFTGNLDDRLPAMARVVTVALPAAVYVAYPLHILQQAGVLNDRQGDTDLVVFHAGGTSSALDAATIAEGVDVGATGVFDPHLDGQKLTFRLEEGRLVDDQTGSGWNILGQAVTGPLVGKSLAPIIHADHFWFSWAAFRPDTIIYR